MLRLTEKLKDASYAKVASWEPAASRGEIRRDGWLDHDAEQDLEAVRRDFAEYRQKTPPASGSR